VISDGAGDQRLPGRIAHRETPDQSWGQDHNQRGLSEAIGRAKKRAAEGQIDVCAAVLRVDLDMSPPYAGDEAFGDLPVQRPYRLPGHRGVYVEAADVAVEGQCGLFRQTHADAGGEHPIDQVLG
jgi:hypothetical protein